MKKVLLSGILIIVLILGMFLVFKNFSDKNQTVIPINGSGDLGALIEESNRITKLNEVATASYWTDNKENIFYITEDGEIFENGQSIILSGITNINSSESSLNKLRTAVVYDYPFSSRVLFFNNNLGDFENFSINSSSIGWSPENDSQFIYLEGLEKESVLVRYDFNTGEKTELLRIVQEDLAIEWILPNIILLKERFSGTMASVWQYDMINETIESITKDMLGLNMKWVPRTSFALRLSNNKISIVDQYNNSLADLTVKTIPSKCALKISPATLYCAVPAETSGLGQIDDVFKEKILNGDTLYYAELPKSLTERFLPIGVIKMTPIHIDEINANSFSIKDPKIKDGNLYFINAFDKRLYSLKLD